MKEFGIFNSVKDYIQIIKNEDDPLNLKIIFDKEKFKAHVEFELIHDIEKNKINTKLIYNENIWFHEDFNIGKITEKLKEINKKYGQPTIIAYISTQVLYYQEENFDNIAIIKEWKKK